MTAAEARCRRRGTFTSADQVRVTRYLATDGSRTQRARVWQAMRVLRSFTIGDLAAVCEIENPGTLRYLLYVLKAAGYLSLQYRTGSTRQGTYRLTRDTGRLCPMPMKARSVVWDPNEMKEYRIAPPKAAKERAA
jgi:hypothetical protein